jgi:RND family efflux transporter MFP subunit
VAEVAASRAAFDRAEMNARSASARAPFAGTIQTRDVRTGEYVQPGALLTTLVRRDPLLLRFRVPEQDAARLHSGLPARFRVRGEDREFTARLTSVAESADETTRMVSVTAEVDDRGRSELRPGAFAEVAVPIGAAVDAPAVPQTAVRPSERGFLAYVVSGGVAVERVLTLGLRTEDGLVEVRGGLSPGESLVVRGAEALSDGAPVRVAANAAGGGGGPAADAAGAPGAKGASDPPPAPGAPAAPDTHPPAGSPR